jgi:Holliday junction resolvasome RuvABC endonuclease subunit
MNCVLGIDASYHSSGWCLINIEDGSLVKYGNILHEKNVAVGESLYNIAEKLYKLIKRYKVTNVAIEELNFSSNFKTSRSLLKVHGIIMYVVYKYLNQETIQYHNLTWRSRLGIKRPKKELIGKSKKKAYQTIILNGKKVKKDIKYMTVLKINEMYNLRLTYKDNDIADAIGIATVLYNEIKEIK